jgi:25S rRNA (adenine2142-N1)-methyltransferase
MTMKKKKRGNGPKSALLSHHKPSPKLTSLSAKASRTLIRSYHQLRKRHAQAVADGDAVAADALLAQIEVQGGLKLYQLASINGQSNERGGDSSKVLVEWLQEGLALLDRNTAKGQSLNQPLLRMLEVGALSATNACSRFRLFNITRIDLNSQDSEQILQQDFMQRPLPLSDDERFDIVSLSLVLNFLPDNASRGDMLRRTASFLRSPPETLRTTGSYTEFFPSLFLVLPAPCVTNSRYLDEDRLKAIMGSLGYSMVRKKMSSKLAYYLWTHIEPREEPRARHAYTKVEVNPGKKRNNFAVTIDWDRS